MLHAPRQTAKTSALIALRDLFNSGAIGDFPLRGRECRGRPGGAMGTEFWATAQHDVLFAKKGRWRAVESPSLWWMKNWKNR